MAEISNRAVATAGAGAVLAVALAFATSSDSSESAKSKVPQASPPSAQSSAQHVRAK